jgi:hypothetical protein
MLPPVDVGMKDIAFIQVDVADLRDQLLAGKEELHAEVVGYAEILGRLEVVASS